MPSHPSLCGCEHSQCQSKSSTTHRDSASSFSFHSCVCVRERKRVCASFSVSDLYILLPASIKSDPTTRRAAMHSNTLVLYLSSYMLSGFGVCVCDVRPEWSDDLTMSLPLQTCCDIVLVLSACSEWIWLKRWYINRVPPCVFYYYYFFIIPPSQSESE